MVWRTAVFLAADAVLADEVVFLPDEECVPEVCVPPEEVFLPDVVFLAGEEEVLPDVFFFLVSDIIKS